MQYTTPVVPSAVVTSASLKLINVDLKRQIIFIRLLLKHILLFHFLLCAAFIFSHPPLRILIPDAMIKRLWSRRPRLFKTSLDHYVPCTLCPLSGTSLGVYDFCTLFPLITMSLDHKVPWSQCPVDTTIRIFVQNVPWTFRSNFWEIKCTHVSLVNFALT